MKSSRWFFAICSAITLSLSLSATSHAQETPPKPEKKAERQSPERPERPEGRRGRGSRRGMPDLGLTDDQKKAMEAARNKLMEAMRDARESGDWGAMRQAREAYEKAVNGVLTDEQKKALQEARGSRGRGGFGRGGRGERGERGFGRGRGRGGFGRRGRSDERLLEEAKKALVLGKTEEATVVPAIKKVLEARRKTREAVSTKRRELLEALKKGGDAEAVKAQVATFRKARDSAEASQKKAQSELAGMLTEVQRARLVALGILR